MSVVGLAAVAAAEEADVVVEADEVVSELVDNVVAAQLAVAAVVDPGLFVVGIELELC